MTQQQDTSHKLFCSDTALEDFARDGATVTRSRTTGGVHVMFANGWVVSIQWGPYTYSDNHHAGPSAIRAPAPDSTTAEVAIRRKGGRLLQWADGDTVQGWQSWEQVQALLDLAATDAVPDPVSLEADS